MQQIKAKKYETRHDWVGKVIHRELCKKFKFDHINKWFMNAESVLENEMQKLLKNFEIPMDHLILTRQQDLEIVNKKENLPNRGLCLHDRP